MKKFRVLIYITGIVYVLAICGGLLAGMYQSSGSKAKAAAADTKTKAEIRQATYHKKQMVGMSLNVYYTSQLERYLSAVDKIHQAGFNTIQVITPVFQTNAAAESINAPVEPGRSPAPRQLIKLLRHAHNLGMRTVLMPQVNFTNPRGNEWRGKINPGNWQAWWQSYKKILRKYLNIAQLGHADIFVVGCELVSTLSSQHLKQWQNIISYARAHFKGQLTFSTTWDTYDRILFWDKLDYIGISGYWDLTKGAADKKNPTAQELALRWKSIKSTLLDFAKAHHKPILITEIGYPALPWGLSDPWNYINSNNVKAAPKVQAQGYESFLRAWTGDISAPAKPYKKHPLVAGAIFYKWDVNISNYLTNTGYSIQGKPAFNIVENWLNGKPLNSDTSK